MNGYRLQEVAERGGVVRETYTKGEGWDANGAPVAEPEKPAAQCDPPNACATNGQCWTHSTWTDAPEFTAGHPVLVVERKRRLTIGNTDHGRGLVAAALVGARGGK